MAAKIIDSAADIKDLVTRIETSHLKYPFLFIDLEGVQLSRHGSISIMQILVGPEKLVHMIDVHRLQRHVFDTASDSGLTLRKILESKLYPKVFFDVRNDSDALYAHYQIRLRCVIDLQLMEFITRPIRGQYVTGLTKCIERDLSLSPHELMHLQRVKDAGKGHFSPERGGRYEVFATRPQNPLLIEFCVRDVQFMPRLLMRYGGRLQRVQAIQVLDETASRITQSQESEPIRKGKHLAIGPYFRPVQTVIGETVLAPHPMDIVCSPALAAYCQVRETFDPFSSTTVPPPASRSNAVTNPFAHSRHVSEHGPIQTLTELTTNLGLRRSSHPSIANVQDRTFAPEPRYSTFLAPPMGTTFIPASTIPAYTHSMGEFPSVTHNTSRAPTTTSQPFFQGSSRPRPDFMAAVPQQYRQYDEHDAPEYNDLQIDGHYGTLSFLDEDDDRNHGHHRRQQQQRHNRGGI